MHLTHGAVHVGKHKRAVCLLARREDGKILAVSRKQNSAQFGLPGGKVEPGETEIEALVREVKEETGLDIQVNETKSVFTRVCQGEVDYETVTYYVSSWSGELHTEEPIVIAWVDPETLVAGPFGKYNKKLFEAVGIPCNAQPAAS